MALRAADGLVLAADSRVSGGDPGSADVSQKFLQVNRDIGILTYGLAIPGERGMRRLIAEVNPPYQRRMAYFSDISDAARTVLKEEYDSWILNLPAEDRPNVRHLRVGFILAGYDSHETNQFIILHLESPNFELQVRDDILAAQWHIAQYLSSLFYYREMTVDQLKQLIVLLLTETAAVEPTVGGPIQIATVSLSEGFKSLHDEEINRILKGNQDKHSYLKRELRKRFLIWE